MARSRHTAPEIDIAQTSGARFSPYVTSDVVRRLIETATSPIKGTTSRSTRSSPEQNP